MRIQYSIIIPVYNAQDTLEFCVKSVEEQLSDYEIILVNDGSKDKSLSICHQLKAQNPRIKVFSIENQGQSVARNVGIQHCTGEFIHFLDSDDFWLKDSFKTIVNFLNNYERLDLLVFDYRIYDEQRDEFRDIHKNSMIHQISDGKKLLFDLLQENPKFDISPCRCLIRRDFLIENMLFFEPNLFFEDAKWMFETFLSSKYSVYMNVPLFGYRKSGYQSITSSHSYKKISDRFRICEYWLNSRSVIELSQQQRTVFLKRISDISFTGLIGIWTLPDKNIRNELFDQFKSVEKLLSFPNSSFKIIVQWIFRVTGVRFGSYLVYLAMRFKQSMSDLRGHFRK